MKIFQQSEVSAPPQSLDIKEGVADALAVELDDGRFIEHEHLLERIQTASIIPERQEGEESGPDQEGKEDGEDAGDEAHVDDPSLPVNSDGFLTHWVRDEASEVSIKRKLHQRKTLESFIWHFHKTNSS